MRIAWMAKLALVLVSTCLIPARLTAQEKLPDSNFKTIVKGFASEYWRDSKAIVVNPVKWKPGQIIAAGAVAAGTAALIAWGDKPIQQLFARNQSQFVTTSSDYFFSPMGNGIITLPAMGVFYACGMIWDDERARETGLKGVEAFVLSAVLANVIKQLTHRHRPYQDDPPNPHAWDGPFNWGGAYGPFGYNAFPSGHTTTIFAVATVVSFEYWHTKWVPAVSFTLAGLTGIYRLAVNKHWASDVLMGAALGFGVGSTIFFNTGKRLKVVPVSPTGFGATLIYRL